MKIAFIVGDFPLLSETFILNQITGLIDRGHEVDIYADHCVAENKVHPDVEKYKLMNRCHYRSVPVDRLARLAGGMKLLLRGLGKKPALSLKSLNYWKYGKISLSLHLLYASLSFLNKGPYDIVHCHFGPNGILGAALRELGAVKGKMITTFHGSDISTYIRKNGKDSYRQLFNQGDLFLPISDHWKKKLTALGCCRDKIIVHRMGIDLGKFEFKQRPASDRKRKFKILTVARLVEKKGVEYSIEAFAKISRNNEQLEYNIVGDGPLRAKLQGMIEDYRLEDKVNLLGWKKQDEIALLLGETDIMMAPSVTSQEGDQEGIPIVLMEALAKGVPVVSTLHSGIPELIEDQKSGLLVAERDAGALAEKLEFLYRNPDTRLLMGEVGRKHIADQYDIDKLNDRLIGIYQMMIDAEHLLKTDRGETI